jgi:hypothetical protein
MAELLAEREHPARRSAPTNKPPGSIQPGRQDRQARATEAPAKRSFSINRAAPPKPPEPAVPAPPGDSIPSVESEVKATLEAEPAPPAREEPAPAGPADVAADDQPEAPNSGPGLQPAAEEPVAEAPRNDEPERSNGWALPTTLLSQLDRLAQTPADADWANQVKSLVGRLFDGTHTPGSVRSLLGQLRRLAQQMNASSAGVHPDLLRAQYALLRRVEIWENLPGFGDASAHLLVSHKRASPRMDLCLAEVDTLTRGKPEGAGWRSYLLVDQLRKLSAADGSHAEQARRRAAREVLARLDAARADKDQRRFVSQGPLANLEAALESWASEPVESRQLLADLERYESSGLGSDAGALAHECRWLRSSSEEADRTLGERLEERYRNANFRLVVAGAFLNRLIPPPSKVESRVDDTIIGVPVQGRQTTFTEVSLRLLPDAQNVRMGLEAHGVVASDTVSTVGPATLCDAGKSTYLVRKLLLLDRGGLRVWPAEAEATNDSNELVGLSTRFDGVFLLGPLVRSIAENQHEDSQDEARAELEPKIAHKARTQFDLEVQPRLNKAVVEFQDQFLKPLAHLGLESSVSGMSTTPERITLRTRLANDGQLGSQTPRPRAPETSLLSVQIHQSAINNAIQRLDLDGRTFTLPALLSWIGKKTGRPALTAPDDVPDDLTITFAEKDALQFTCAEGQIEFKITVAELETARKTWRNFTVRSFYQPESSGLEARFVRDGSMFLEGKSFKGKPEIVLRGIFSKVLAKNRSLSLIGERFTGDPRLKDLVITQFVVRDGWIGLAYGLASDSGSTSRPAPPDAARR